MAAKNDDGRKTIAENRKARFEFRIEDTWEAGIELTGTEVKSLRTGQANIAESYASAENGGIFLINSYIPEYKAAGDFFQHEPRRPAIRDASGAMRLSVRRNSRARVARSSPTIMIGTISQSSASAASSALSV